MTPKLGAIAVVVHDGCALLVQRGKAPNKGLWGFPGGHVEYGETALAAATRELAEETGVEAEARGYLTCVDVIGRDPEDGISHHYLLAAVLCSYRSGTPLAADDAADAAWVPVQAVLDGDRPLSPTVAEVLRKALAAASPSLL